MDAMGRLWAISVLVLLVGLPRAYGFSIEVVTADYPPYSNYHGNAYTGYATELVKKILKDLNVSADIKGYPYNRSLHVTKSRRNVLMYPVVRASVNEDSFHWIGKISERRVAFFKYKGRVGFRPVALNDVRNLRIGVIRGSFVRDRLKADGFTGIEEVGTDIQNLRKLLHSRIDLLAQEELVLMHALENHNKKVSAESRMDVNNFEKVFVMAPAQGERGLYIVMGRNTSTGMVERVRSAYERIQQRGAVIEVAHWWTNDVERKMLAVYRQFLKEKGYTWVDYAIEGGGGARMRRLLEVREEAKNLPHAIHTYMGPTVWAWAEKGALISLNEVALADDWETGLPPLVNRMIQYKGQYVAAPVNMQQVNWIWLNPSVFGLSKAEIPESWESFYVAAERIREAGYIAVAVGGEPWQEATLFENIALGVGGLDFYRKAFIELDRGVLGGPVMVKVFEHFRRIRGYTDQDVSGRSWVATAQLVAEGKAAMYVMGDWAKNVFKASGLQYGAHGFMSIPPPGTKGVLLNNTDVFVFPRSRESYVPGQKALAGAIMDPGVQVRFNVEKGSIPARLNLASPLFDKVAQRSMKIAGHQDRIVPSFVYMQTAPQRVQKAVVQLLSRYYHSEMPAQEAAEKLVGIVDSLMENVSWSD